MIRISLQFIYRLSEALTPLGRMEIAETKYADIQIQLLIASGSLKNLGGSLYSPYLRTSRALFDQLLGLIEAQFEDSNSDRIITPYEIFQIKNTYDQYIVALLSEFGVMDLYFVTQKGGFDSWSLLMFGENHFPADLATKCPEAIWDAREAGRCLAFANHTASSFHVFRVLESVLRKYYHHITGGKSAPKVRNIAVYVNALRQSGGGDEKILFILKQISDLYRNPLVHPDAILSFDDAVGVYGIARLAISQMLTVMPLVPQTTSSPLTSLFMEQNGGAA